MKHNRIRVTLALAIAVPLYVILASCATVIHDPLYDGMPIDEILVAQSSDSVLLVPVTIENTRSRDASDPTFYLISNGKHSLGRVPDLSTRRVFVDSRWLRTPADQITIVAHFVGGPDLVYDAFSWRAGQVIDVQLGTIFNRTASWAHK